MAKQVIRWSYWLGAVFGVLALVARPSLMPWGLIICRIKQGRLD